LLHILPARARCLPRGRGLHDDVGVRIRSERTVFAERRGSDGRLAACGRSGGVRTGTAAVDRGSDASRAGTESRDTHSANRPSGSGRRGLAGSVVLVAAVQLERVPPIADTGGYQLARRRRQRDRQRDVRQPGGLDPDAALGRQLHRELEQPAVHDEQSVQQFQSPAQLEYQPAVHAAAAAKPLD